MAANNRVTYLLIFVMLIAGFHHTAAQGNFQKLEKEITIYHNVIRLDSLLSGLSKQTGIGFSFDSKKISPSMLVRQKKGRQTLSQSLIQLKPAGISHVVLGNHIVLVESDSQPASNVQKARLTSTQAAHPVSVKRIIRSGHAIASTNPKHFYRSATVPRTDTNTYRPNFPAVDIAGSDSLLSNISHYAGDTVVQKTFLPAPVFPLRDTQDSATGSFAKRLNNDNERGLRSKNQNIRAGKSAPGFFVNTGLSVSDIFYCNPTLQAGYSFLYAQISWNTNFGIAGLRYGPGTRIGLKNDIALAIQATFGKFSKSFIYDTSGSISSKNKLTSLGIFVEKKFGAKLALQFGPVINYLTVRYYQNGLPFSFSNPVKIFEKRFYVVKPSYFLVNSYTSGSVANVKVWAGLQIGLFYTIPL